ncbi:MAG: biopolymer transporter ExbD [bacterium]
MIGKGVTLENRVTVVPIINVSLVVVLTLMMMAPFLSGQDVPVELPLARAAEVDDSDNVEITFTLERQIFVGSDMVTLAELTPLVQSVFAAAPHAVAVIKADRALPYGEVERLIAAVEAGEATRIALATKQKDRGETP